MEKNGGAEGNSQGPTIPDMDQGGQDQGEEHTNSDATAKIQLWLREA